jgi:hypothetical protein
LEILSIGCSCSDGFKKGHIKESIYGLFCLEVLKVWKKRGLSEEEKAIVINDLES